MILSEFRATGFRCLPDLNLRFPAQRNFFVGPNAAGKTSLLEAVCVALRLQSPRTSSLQKCIRHGENGFGLEARFSAQTLRVRYDSSGRKMFLDDVAQARSSQFLQVARVTWFANDDLELVRGPGAVRRRFLDFLGIQMREGYRTHLRNYERSLRSRNFLLKSGAGKRELEAHTRPLIESGEGLHAARVALFPRFVECFGSAVPEIAGPGEAASIDFLPGFTGAFAEALEKAHSNDLRLGLTSVGPHRDDFQMLLAGVKASDFASEGQQRTLALSLKLAQARLLAETHSSPPLLLLDDIFGELDPIRRNRLLSALPPGCQQFLTTTHLDWMDRTADGEIFSFPLQAR